MAEELVTYDQIDGGGDPDPLGLEKKLRQVKAARSTISDPLGLEAKLRTTKQSPVPQPAFQVNISNPTFRDTQGVTMLQPGVVNEPVNIKREEIGYVPIVPTKEDQEVTKYAAKATEAHKNIHNELLKNDDQYEKVVRESRRDNYTIEDLKNEYKNNGWLLPVASELPNLLKKAKQRQYDLSVTPEDISNAKTGTILDDKNARNFLKRLNNSDALANSWAIDKYNEVRNDPNAVERIKNIKQVEKDIRAGRVVYNPETQVAYRPVGLIGSLMEGVKNKFKNEEKYDFYKNTENDAAIISELENERNNPDTDTPINVPKGKLNEFVKSVAETPVGPLVVGAAGTIGGTFIGNPEVGAVAATALGAYENRKSQYKQTIEQVYNELRNQGATTFDALAEAKRQANNAQEIGTIVGAAQGLVGAKIAATPIVGTSFNVGYQKAIGDFLKKNGSELGNLVLEGAAQGGLAVTGEAIKNKLAQSAGIKRELSSGLADTFWGNVLMTAGIGLALKGAKGVSPASYKKIMNGLAKNVPENVINDVLNEKVQSGEITQTAADGAVERINNYKQLDSQIPENVTEDSRFKIQDNIEKINELEQQLEATHKSLQEPIKEKIQKLTDENLALSKDVEEPEKIETGLPKAKEKEAIELANEWLTEGIFPDTYEATIKKDPLGFWREIAQQAQNRDANWKPLNADDAALSEQAVRDQFGDTVVDYAKELFPAPEIIEPESRISVIKPGEIKQPETITIKPKENAISIESATPVDVREPSVNGETVGEGNAQPEITTGKEIPIQEDNVKGQEGIVPPLSPLEKRGVYVEHPETQLSFRGLQDTANEFGFEDVKSRDPKTDLQTKVNAEKTANEWAAKGEYQKNIDEMLGKIERKEMVPTDEQRVILQQYLATQKQKARDLKGTTEYDRQLAKVKRIKEIGTMARSEAGAALRLPDGGSLPHPILDEVDAMTAKMEANAVDQLTDQQKAEVEAQVAKYKEANEEANSKIAKLEEQVGKIEADKEFNKVKSATKRVKKTAEERAAFRRSEMEAAREALRKLRSGESGLSAVPLPFVRELMAIAPHVKNVMVDLVSQGIDNLEDVIKHLHSEFKDVLDGITEKNIHDIIAGEYNEKGRPLTELQATIRDLQDQAKLINQLEALENGAPPKAEKAKRQRNQKIKDLRDKIKGFKKEDGAEELRAIKKRNEAQEKTIKEKINKGEFESSSKKSIFDREDVKQKYPQLRKEALDAIAKKEEAQHEFDLALFKDEMAKRNWAQKWLRDFGGDLFHTAKAVLSGIDDSATFVQNGLAMLANPKIGAKVWLEHWKDAFSDARFKRELAAIHARPDWDIIQKSGLDVVEPHSAASKQVEEAFERNLLAGKIKIKGEEFQPWKYTGGIFERAFTSMGNNMRLALFEKRMAQLIEDKKTFESHPQEYKDAARAINELTGRGKLPSGLAQASPYITPFIWAPRMLTSTINTLGLSDLVLGLWKKGYYQNLTPAQRKFALGQLGRGVAIGAAVMGAAALGGADVDYDPRSVTFGDVIMGDHHYNVFGRYTPVIKALVQFAWGERLKKGQRQDLDSGKRGAKTRMGVVGGFFRGKMTPAAGVIYDLAEHKNYFTNESFTWKDVPKALIMPMSIKELLDGWKNDGTWTILNRFLPAFEGLKVSDERDFQKVKQSKGQPNLRHKGPNKSKPHN